MHDGDTVSVIRANKVFQLFLKLKKLETFKDSETFKTQSLQSFEILMISLRNF